MKTTRSSTLIPLAVLIAFSLPAAAQQDALKNWVAQTLPKTSITVGGRFVRPSTRKTVRPDEQRTSVREATKAEEEI